MIELKRKDKKRYLLISDGDVLIELNLLAHSVSNKFEVVSDLVGPMTILLLGI